MRYFFFIIALLLLFPSDGYAARLWSSGCELEGSGNMTDNLEWDRDGGSAGTTQISTTIFRSGLASCRTVATASWGSISQDFTASSAADFYFRFYIYIPDAPAEPVSIFAVGTSISEQENTIVVNTDMTLQVYDDDETSIGSSAALNTDQWYRIEYYYAAAALELRIDGSTAVSAAANDGDNLTILSLGICLGLGLEPHCGADDNATFDIHFDDIAINDTSGATQTSWPGVGSIVHMQPDGNDGDINEASSGNCASVDELEPDGGTTIAVMNDNDDDLDCNVETASSAGIDSFDTVTLVQVGVREAEASAAAATWNLRLKSASGGTTSTGTATSHNDTTYRTNGDVAPRNYTLTSYTDPTTAVAWTPTGTNSLDNMQVGITVTDADPDVNVSTLWALVEYVDGVAAAVVGEEYVLLWEE